MAEPPPASDVRALLLTDIIDSTRLWETLGDAVMAPLIQAHDRMARDLIPRWDGREIDKTDGLLVLFATARDAVAYAMAYHRSLAALDPRLRARAALHVGRVYLRENTAADVARGAKPLEVEGLPMSLTARVASVAQGGQTLLTVEAREALDDTDLRVVSHGHWRAHGIAQPVELFEAGDDDAPFTPPADAPKMYRVVRRDDLWLPMGELPHGLPAERDPFIGRTAPLAELARRLQGGSRLVSVIGMGGTGKTRLATRFGWTWLGDHPGGVWFCDLTQARDVDGIVNAVAKGLDVPLGAGDPVVQLGHAIAGRGNCLVILDNFEQVARHAEETLGHWLDRARDARFVVTSREVLGVAGEEVLALPPLPAPEAAALFVSRAEAARRDLVRSAEADRSIADLMRLLDGLPLAIELAAARTRVMPPDALLARMSERFRLLSSGGGRVDRHATLRATLDWSWDLLPAAERRALAQLSVFQGTFDLAAAEAVVDLSAGADAPWTVDVLQSLVNKSFLRPDGERFVLETSVREYAAEHLATPERFPGSGPAARDAAYRAHGAHYARLATGATVEAGIDLDNHIAACRRAVERRDAPTAVATLVGAWGSIKLRGPFRVGVDLARLVRSVPALEPGARAEVEWLLGSALGACALTVEARACFESALELGRSVHDRLREAVVLSDLGALLADEGRMDAALRLLGDALAIARELGDRALEAQALDRVGTTHLQLGHLEEASGCCRSALEIARESGDRRLQGKVLGNLGLVHANQGDLEAARARFAEGLAIAREVGDRKWEGNALSNLGLLSQMQGRLAEAVELLEAAVATARDLGDLRLECIGNGNLGIVQDSLGRAEAARTHYEAAVASARRLQDPRSEGQFLSYLGLLHAREGRIETSRRCLDDAQALLTDVSDAVWLGVVLCSRAECEQLAGDADAARRALGEAEGIAAEAQVGAQSELGSALARARGLLAAVVPG
jgi:predicted ATPase/class 3 adenylate cyclase